MKVRERMQSRIEIFGPNTLQNLAEPTGVLWVIFPSDGERYVVEVYEIDPDAPRNEIMRFERRSRSLVSR